MRIDTQSHILWRYNGCIDIDDLLPKASSEYRTLTLSHHAQTCRTQLNIAAAHNDFGTRGKSCLITRFSRHFTDDFRRFIDRREDIIFDAYLSGLSCFPLSFGKRKYPCRSCIGRICRYHIRQLCQHPVADHRESGSFLIEFRSVLFDPKQSGQSTQSKSLS